MRIKTTKTTVSCPGRNYVTLAITTESGITGYGDATLNGRELAVATYLKDHVEPLLTGRDAHAIEDTWQYLYRGAYWRGGPVSMAAIAAVDTALWDIKAKAVGLPLYQLLGGQSRNSIRAYGHASGRNLCELLRDVQRRRDEGFTAIRIQVGIPGLNQTYGILNAGEKMYEPAKQASHPTEEIWDSSLYLRHFPKLFEAVRAETGPDIDLLHDVHHRLAPVQATRLARSLEPFDPFWLEDLTPSENAEVFRIIRQKTSVPIALGETFNTFGNYRIVIVEQLIDYIRSSVTHFGGITPLKKLVEFAAHYQIKSAFHGPSDISPIGMAAALHLDMAIHNFGIQEYMQYSPEVAKVFPWSYQFRDGVFTLNSAPGHGVLFDEDQAASYEYKSAYLPVARTLDGTLHDW